MSNPQSQMMQSLPKPVQDVAESVVDSGMGMVLLGVVFFAVGMNLFAAKKSKLSTGRFAGKAEKWAAATTARQQRQQQQPHKVALKAGNVDIPHAQQSIAVAGAPDSGKTFSIIDPAIRSAVAQGFPILVYDFKGAQLAAHAAWAAAQGYEVAVLAPGQAYTGTCNPLDFLADETDALMAAQLAQVLQKNTQRDGAYRDNDFFTSAGTNLVEAVMLLAKLTPYPDLLMASKLLNLSDLPARIQSAGQSGYIPAWTLESFSQLLASAGAEKQIAGIVATAQRTFKTFTGKQLTPSFCGKTTIPLDHSCTPSSGIATIRNTIAIRVNRVVKARADIISVANAIAVIIRTRAAGTARGHRAQVYAHGVGGIA
ncbi:MAG: type IV secretory system conjugative DNA transfer family protein, partial [Cyanothece sp. SIO1E1]|nr:type IV secretory system conjugative DNA transfer family protein [Cyanothece sp. SIO1E1]